MAYTNQDKYEMALRQARVDIGQGRGNALSKAVDFCRGMNIHEEETFKKIFEIADKFAEFNQKRIDEDYQKWFEKNNDELRKSVGFRDTMTPEEEYVKFPGTKIFKAKKSDPWRNPENTQARYATDKEGHSAVIDKFANTTEPH